MGGLIQSVDAGIGSARAGGSYFPFAEFKQRLFQFSLNGAVSGLALPSAKIGSVVFYGDFVSRQLTAPFTILLIPTLSKR